jgi:hypothetical protein
MALQYGKAKPRASRTIVKSSLALARQNRSKAETPCGPVHESPTRVAGAPVLGASLARHVLMARLRHADRFEQCPLSGVNRSAPGDRQGVDGASPSR